MPSSDSITVLIGHKDPIVAAGAAAVLRDYGLRVFERRPDFLSAERALTTDRSLVLVADYETGLQYTRPWKTLILTHFQGETHVRKAIEHGVRGYLHLGCTGDALRAAVTALHRGATAYSEFVGAKIAESLTHEDLTERELSVLRMMMLGSSNKAISHRLVIAVGTVKSHVKSIFAKLKVASRGEAVAMAHQRGLVTRIELEEDSRPAPSIGPRSVALMPNPTSAPAPKTSRLWVSR